MDKEMNIMINHQVTWLLHSDKSNILFSEGSAKLI